MGSNNPQSEPDAGNNSDRTRHTPRGKPAPPPGNSGPAPRPEPATRNPASTSKRRSGTPAPWLFLAGTLAWTWALFGVVYLTGRPWLEFPVALVSVAAGLGPLIVAGMLVATGRWDAYRDSSARAFLVRCVNPGTLPQRWYLITLALAGVLAFGPPLVALITGTEAGLLEPGPFLFLFVGAVFGGLEEVGWRGYAQEALQRRLPIALAGLVIGIFWALWHVPLFFLPGTYQATLGIATPTFWIFFATIVVASPFYAWIYNASGRVAFSAFVYHAAGNVFGELAASGPFGLGFGIELTLTLVAVVLAWRWMHLRAPATRPAPSSA